MITIKNLTKSFGQKEVLKAINIGFEKGKIYGIVGANGAGKTTLFRCLAGLETHGGEIETDYLNLKNQLGYLQTELYFFPLMTGKEYLQLLCHARQLDAVDFDKKNIFDLPLNQYATTYSTGMQKKLALTAILLQENDIFILDEPFNGVDIQSNIIITAIIRKLQSKGKTIVISSHIFSTLSAICDEIHLLKEGVFVRKVFQDEFDDLEQEMIDFTIGDSVDRLEL